MIKNMYFIKKTKNLRYDAFEWIHELEAIGNQKSDPSSYSYAPTARKTTIYLDYFITYVG
jgi:hypothetical protein